MKTKAQRPWRTPDNELADELTTNETDEPDGKELSEFEREHYEQIKQLEVEALESEGIYLDAKSEAKATKEVWERQVDRLRSLIRSGPDTQKTLPFGDDVEPSADAWKETPIADVIELTAKQVEKLTAAGVENAGQFEELRSGLQKDYPDGLLSLNGVGAATIDKWEEQVIEWLYQNVREDEPADDTDEASE